MTNDCVKDSMFRKVKVDEAEREHLDAPMTSVLADAWYRLRQNRAAVAALFILAAIVLLAIFAQSLRFRTRPTSSAQTSSAGISGCGAGWAAESP